jgi:hypothetical protein
VRKVEDFLQHAAECRQMATAAASQEHREMLLQMAQTWESLARDRRDLIARSKLSSASGEAAENS